MNPKKGYYSVIQYCPDLSRHEAANIGVLLFCPEIGYLRAMTSGNNSRVIRFFGAKHIDPTRLKSMKRGFEQRIQKEASTISTLNDLKHFIGMRANQLQITDPKPMKVIDPDRDIQELFEHVIGSKHAKSSRRSLKLILGEKLSKAGIDDKLARNISVNVPTLQKQVEIPFGYQNGRFHLITPVRFEAADPEKATATACKYAVEGRSLYESPDPRLGELQLIVVGQFRPNDGMSPQRVEHVLADYEVKLYRASDLSKLIEEIRRTGKSLSSLDRQ